jgi:DNA repair protein SbcC/Rad50
MTSEYGSIWRRWDLHVHSPASVLANEFEGASDEDKWQKYLTRLEELEGIAALGITDYCSVEGYLRVAAEREQGRVSNVDFVFPNIEFRITPVTAEERAINIHVLASPDIAAELETMLFTTLSFEYAGNTYTCTRPDLTRLGRAVEKNPQLPEASAYRSGVNQFKTDINQIRNALRRSKRLRENCLIVVPNRSGDGNSGIQEGSLLATREEIYRLAHAIFSSNPNDRDYFLGKGPDSPSVVIGKCGALKACVHGSDAHSLDRIGEPDQQRYTWIKSDTTFEGLKQICYEPEFRVQIGPAKPIEPFHRIDSVTLEFPTNAEIASDTFRDKFCFAGTRTLYFSPGLTCVIGGRGSGKSTLLNLMQEALTGKSAFFRHNAVQGPSGPVDIQKSVQVNLVGSPAGVEFLTQNEVEQFAIDQDRFTNAIYARLKRLDAEDSLATTESALEDDLSKLSRLVDSIDEEKKLITRNAEVLSEIATNENLVSSLEDSAYKSITAEAQVVAAELSQIRSGRLRLKQLIDRIESTIAQEQPLASTAASTEFDHRRQGLIDAIQRAIQEARGGLDLSAQSATENELAVTAAELQSRIQKYLVERSISTENVQDISRAANRLAELREEERSIKAALSIVKQEQGSITHSATVLDNYESMLLRAIEPVNVKLQGMGVEVRRITLQYHFDKDSAREALLTELSDLLGPHAESGRAARVDHISSAFGDVDVLSPPSRDALIAQVGSANPGNKTVQLVLDFFQDEFNYRSFVLRAKRAATDARRFRRIRVLYDGKPLQNASFGQRCSAALILLLTLGNTPIVIDEPEAHLDSALIADLLVLLIKVIKSDRQIVFATHNANFVVNGDAELIQILDMDEDRHTVARPATLENVNERPRILALEGGERAFQQREERYGLRLVGD